MPNVCPACERYSCCAAVRLTLSWLSLCSLCTERFARWYERKHGRPAVVFRELGATAAYDAAVARGVTADRACEVARQVEQLIDGAAIRHALDTGLVAAEA